MSWQPWISPLRPVFAVTALLSSSSYSSCRTADRLVELLEAHA